MIANIEPNHCDSQTNDKIQQIIQVIYKMAPGHSNWVSISRVARGVDGTEATTDIITSYMNLPAAKPFIKIAPNQKSACLTPIGSRQAQCAHNHQTNTLSATPESNESQYIHAIAQAVKGYASGLNPLIFPVLTVSQIGHTQNKIVYAVTIEISDVIIPTDSFAEIRTQQPNRRYQGRVVEQNSEEGILYISLVEPIVDDPKNTTLFLDRAYLLYELAESLNSLEKMPEHGKTLFPDATTESITLANQDSLIVGKQLASLKTPWARFLWGPPGAGKTFGLAHFVASLLERKPQEKILITAPSNIAADMALIHLMHQLEESGQQALIDNRQILRYGYPRKTEVLTRPELLGSIQMSENSNQIADCARRLKKAKANKAHSDNQAMLRAELLALQEKGKELVLDHVKQCQVVVTTTTQCYMRRSPIRSLEWTTGIIDEVTMVPPAVCLFLSSLILDRFLLAGDPRQLGPVYESNINSQSNQSYKWLGQDIFEFSNLPLSDDAASPKKISDNRLVRITSQRRCTAEIWQPISHLYPGVATIVAEEQRQKFIELPPYPGKAIVLIKMDANGQDARCERKAKSWQNPVSANKAVEIVQHIRQHTDIEPSIAIITPYRAQHNLLKRSLTEASLNKNVDCGTIHQYQGSEADIIIFDLVDGPGRSNLGKMLIGQTGARLVNVAISRARGKVILLANVNWLAQKLSQDQNPLLWHLIHQKTPAAAPVAVPPIVKAAPQPPKAVTPLKAVKSSMPKPDTARLPLMPAAQSPQKAERNSPDTSPTVRFTNATTSPEKQSTPIPVEMVDITRSFIHGMPVSTRYTYTDRQVKQALNHRLHNLGYKRTETADCSIWSMADNQIVVNHKKKIFFRKV